MSASLFITSHSAARGFLRRATPPISLLPVKLNCNHPQIQQTKIKHMKTKSMTTRATLPASLKQPPQDAKPAGKIDPDERIEVTVRLRRKPGAGIPQAGPQPMSRDEFRANYGADPADLEKIEAFAHEHGFDVVQSSVAQRSVRLSGTVANMQAAFGTRLKCYRKGRTNFRARTGTVSIPKHLAPIIEAVFGLDNRPRVRPQFHFAEAGRKSRAKPAAAVVAAATPRAMTPVEVAKLYNFPANLDGTGQCIAILEFGGGYRTKDLTTYFKSLGVKKPSISAVSVLDGHNDPDGPTSDANGEVMLDVEVAGAVAPGAKVVVYFAPNTDDGFIGALNAAVHDNVRKPSVISISRGGLEQNSTLQSLLDYDQACADAAVMGVTITCAAGDHGAADEEQPPNKRVNADFPASSPNVLACGGTRLVGQGSVIQSETVWNDHDGWATGGGVSEKFPVPAYQKTSGVPKSLNTGGKKGRGVPDVSGNADSQTGYITRVDGQNTVIGGTSAVAPLWAGLIALLNQGLKKPVGFLNARLYALAGANGAFNDVIAGDNKVLPAPGYLAKAGWDACTGLGTPNGAKLLAALKT
jgi:kumamolisin